MATDFITVFRDLVVDAAAAAAVSSAIPVGTNSVLQPSLVTVGALVTAVVTVEFQGSNDRENWTSMGPATGFRGDGSAILLPLTGITTAFVRIRCSIDADIAIVSIVATLGQAS
jgi:hypothetical protein